MLVLLLSQLQLSLSSALKIHELLTNFLMIIFGHLHPRYNMMIFRTSEMSTKTAVIQNKCEHLYSPRLIRSPALVLITFWDIGKIHGEHKKIK